ncbi:MAG: zf-HC2 domain-containing protein [Labilithrix sp.]|nr:zf-HC2 domain-containing protein [Labilithrix sp.]MCW5815083.1 zf-HC2 domain-containing protein [Labilithrix sp.]
MDCTAVTPNLVAYHVGAIDDADREAIEAHLVGCRACLEAYLAIKRAADRAVFERPRPEVKERLRAEVLRAFPPREAGRRVAFFRRRIPLYQGVALAAVAAAVVALAPKVKERLHLRAAEPAPIVDTSRTRAESLSIY